MILKELGNSASTPTSPLTLNMPDSSVFEPGILGESREFTFVKNPSQEGLLDIFEMATREIGNDIASFEDMRAVRNRNPASFWGIYRSSDAERREARLAGFFAFLPLNQHGLEAYQRGELYPKRPSMELLARTGERPVALYLWATVAHRLAGIGAALIAHAFGTVWFFDLPIFGTVGTRSGLNALRNAQSICPDAERAEIGKHFEFKLPPEIVAWAKALPVVAGSRPSYEAKELSAKQQTFVVRSQDQIAKVFAVRAAVFMAEQTCPYAEEFDDNDFVGMHILGTVADEPAATLRIRFFADFAKLERWAVLPRFRGTLIGRAVVDHAMQICRRKGYSRIYAHAQLRYVEKWKRFGLRPMMKNSSLVFSDHEYVEMVGHITPTENALTVQSNPYVLIRPEGRWDEPGVLDNSASRKAISPI